MIHISGSSEYTELVEEFWHVLLSNANSCVRHLNMKALLRVVVPRSDLDVALFSKLSGIFHKID